MSRKRAADDAPPSTDSHPIEKLPQILNGMAESRRMLLMHSQSLTECMRIVEHLHQVLVQAHLNATEQIITYGAPFAPQQPDPLPALPAEAERSLLANSTAQGVLSMHTMGQTVAETLATADRFASTIAMPPPPPPLLPSEPPPSQPSACASATAATTTSCEAATDTTAPSEGDASSMHGKELIEKELREALQEARGRSSEPLPGLDHVVSALQAHQTLQAQTLQPILQTAHSTTTAFNARFAHLVPPEPPPPLVPPSNPLGVVLNSNMTPLLPPPQATTAEEQEGEKDATPAGTADQDAPRGAARE